LHWSPTEVPCVSRRAFHIIPVPQYFIEEVERLSAAYEALLQIDVAKKRRICRKDLIGILIIFCKEFNEEVLRGRSVFLHGVQLQLAFCFEDSPVACGRPAANTGFQKKKGKVRRASGSCRGGSR
jgi:hypothetical protein